MRTLRFRQDTFDRDALFAFEIETPRRSFRATGYLLDCRDDGEGVVLMQAPAVLSDIYGDAEIALRNRIATETPVRGGDVVLVDGKQYVVKVIGDYNDAGRLQPLA